MNFADTTAAAQTDAISFEFDLPHAPEKVWRALTDPALLEQWLLPVFDLELAPGRPFSFKTQPYPGWDGTVQCTMLEVDAPRRLSYAWVVGEMLDTVVTFTLTPTAG
ncbi:MAG: SRPBCC domain-containing protein, partial [Gemmatimonadales bacterium]